MELFFLATVIILVVVLVILLRGRGKPEAKSASLPVEIDPYLLIDKETNLYNRRFFIRRLQEEIHRFQRYQSPFSLALLKLPQSVDTLEDARLNSFLRRVASIVEKDIRLTDLASRYDRCGIAILFSMTGRLSADVPIFRLKEKINQLLQSENLEGESNFVVYAYPEQAQKVEEFVTKLLQREGS